jgi:BRCT domain type II-containing protein
VLTVELKDGGKHTINVSEDGEVTDASAPKPHAAHAAAAQKAASSSVHDLVPTGDSESPYHMPNGQFYKGADGLNPQPDEDVFELLKKSVGSSGNGGSVGSLSGKNVVVTGKIPGHTREQFHAKLAAAGAHPQSSVTKTTDYLITGENVGKTKTNAASAKGVKVVPHHSILHLLEAKPSTEDRLAAVRIALSEAVGAGETVRLRARERVLVGRLGG